MSPLPADRTERHIPAFPFSLSLGRRRATAKLIRLPTTPSEKHPNDATDLILGGQPGSRRRQNPTSGEGLSHSKPFKVRSTVTL